MSNELDKKVRQAIKLLQVASMAAGQPLEICYSGGKDSDVILQLAREADIDYRAIYKNTTIDPPGTIAHCKANGVEIFKPKMRFLELIKKKGIPTRRARFCCEVLKEYKVLDYNVQGVRRAESTSRQKTTRQTNHQSASTTDRKRTMSRHIIRSSTGLMTMWHNLYPIGRYNATRSTMTIMEHFTLSADWAASDAH